MERFAQCLNKIPFTLWFLGQHGDETIQTKATTHNGIQLFYESHRKFLCSLVMPMLSRILRCFHCLYYSAVILTQIHALFMCAHISINFLPFIVCFAHPICCVCTIYGKKCFAIKCFGIVYTPLSSFPLSLSLCLTRDPFVGLAKRVECALR